MFFHTAETCVAGTTRFTARFYTDSFEGSFNELTTSILRQPHRSFAPSVLEVENESTRQLEVVLGLLEEPGAHVVALQPERQARVPAVICAPAGL